MSDCDREFDFTLVLTGATEITTGIEDALFVAGCDDATLASRSGWLYLTFSRTAASMKDAIFSAIGNVRESGVGLDVLRVDYCNLVNLSDIARRIGRSRQLVHQYLRGERGPGGFPPAACEVAESVQLWYWCEVAEWLWRNSMIQETVVRDAEEVDAINTVLEMEDLKRSNPELSKEVLRMIVSA